MKREIAFCNLKAKDKILIQTQNSVYSFSVIDPDLMHGFLSGGYLGDQLCEAILIGAMGGDGADASRYSSGLTTESRACFYFEARNERLLTSVVTRLDHIRGSEELELIV